MMAKRIQRKRTKGWTMPPNTVYVGRPTRWGNPFPVDIYHEEAIAKYRRWLLGQMSGHEMSTSSYYGDPRVGLAHMRRLVQPHELRGKDLACWCKEGAACHADILLALAANAGGYVPEVGSGDSSVTETQSGVSP